MKNFTFAFALIAAFTNARMLDNHDGGDENGEEEHEYLPGLTVRYQSRAGYFLGLLPGESVEVELAGETIHHYEPTWWGGETHSTTEYCYWTLKPGQAYTGFTVEMPECEMEGGLWTITAEEGAVDVGEQCLEFVRYCMSGDDEGEGGDGEDGDHEEDEEDEDEDHDWWWAQGPGDD